MILYYIKKYNVTCLLTLFYNDEINRNYHRLHEQKNHLIHSASVMRNVKESYNILLSMLRRFSEFYHWLFGASCTPDAFSFNLLFSKRYFFTTIFKFKHFYYRMFDIVVLHK